MANRKRTKELTMINKTLHTKTKYMYNESHKKQVELGCSGRVAVPASLVAPVEILMFYLAYSKK